MRETLVEKVIEKQQSIKRMAGKADDVKKTIERKERIIGDCERKIELTREGIEDKTVQLSELEGSIEAHTQALTEMEQVIADFDRRTETIADLKVRLAEIGEQLDRDMELNPRTAVSSGDHPEYQKILAEILELQKFNNEAETDIRKIFYRKVLL